MNKSIIALALGTLGFGSASAYLLGELRSEREQTQSLQARVEELERARPQQRNPFDRPQPPPPQVEPAPPSVQPPPPPRPQAGSMNETAVAVVSEPPVFSTRAVATERQRVLMQDPEYRKAMLAQQKLSMQRMYPDLRTALRLQPQEADRLIDLLAEQQLNMMTNQPPFRARGGPPPDPAELQQYQQQMQQQQRERDAQIASILGDSKLQEWQSYQKTLGARMQIRELRTELAEAGMPLREGQIEPLVNSIAAEQEWRAQDSIKYRGQLNALGNASPAARVEMMEQNLERSAEYNRRLHDAAAPYLSNDQLRRFDAHMSQQLEQQRAGLMMMRAQQEAMARGDIPTPGAGAPLRAAPGAFVGAQTVVVD